MKSVIKLEPVEVEEQNLHLILNAQVNGKDVRLVLDTGASRTCFDYDYFVEIGAMGRTIIQILSFRVWEVWFPKHHHHC